MDFQRLYGQETPFLSLTSLLPAEFDALLVDFGPAWERYARWHTTEGKRRQFPAHREAKGAVLRGNETKLFFLLTYLKSNSLQQHQAAHFGVSQTKVSRIAPVLLAILNDVLAARKLLPVRNGAELAERLAAHAEKVFAYDGVERGVLRNADPVAQQEAYSGKKKAIA